MIKKINCPKLILVSAVISMSLNCHERTFQFVTQQLDIRIAGYHQLTNKLVYKIGYVEKPIRIQNRLGLTDASQVEGPENCLQPVLIDSYKVDQHHTVFFSTKIVGLKLESFTNHASLPRIDTSYSLIASLVIQSTTVEWTSQPTMFFVTSHQVASN